MMRRLLLIILSISQMGFNYPVRAVAALNPLKQDPAVGTLTVSYAAISCSCAQWFVTTNGNVPYLKGVELFYLVPAKKTLPDANKLWDGTKLPFTVKVTGSFAKEKGVPSTHLMKADPIPARIFYYSKIAVVKK